MAKGPWGGWGCPHESGGWCRRLTKDCIPGQNGCVITPDLLLGIKKGRPRTPAQSRRISRQLALVCFDVPATPDRQLEPGWYAVSEEVDPIRWKEDSGLSALSQDLVSVAGRVQVYGLLEPPRQSVCRLSRRIRGLPAARYVANRKELPCGCPSHAVWFPARPVFLSRLTHIIPALSFLGDDSLSAADPS